MKHEAIDLDNPEFQQVWNLIENTRSSVFLTGKAGTGKSTFLRYITQYTRKKFVVLAPTGIAAINAGGQTLHSFFHIPLKPLLPDDVEFSTKNLRNRMKYTSDFIKMLRKLDLIIIDEISMVRADILDFIDKILRYFCNNSVQPFAGKQMLMVGDIFQLEPVTTAEQRNLLRRCYPKTTYFFDALAFRDCSIVPIELKKVYRQSDPQFIAILDHIRNGQQSADEINAINRQVRPDFDPAITTLDELSGGKMTMIIATKRTTVDYINNTRLAQLPSQPITYTAEIKDDFPKLSFPTDEELTLKIGAQIVFIRNDVERRWVNGTLATVSSLSNDSVEVTLENGQVHTIKPEIWENMLYTYDEAEHTIKEEVKGLFIQYPIKLAWAITIHKSQGLTFSNVVIDLGDRAFTGGQTYVALSRCTSIDGITLTRPLRANDIFVATAVKNFARNFNSQRLVENAIENARADTLYAEAAADFAAGRYRKAISNFASAQAIRNDLIHPTIQRAISRKLTELAADHIRVEQLQDQINELRTQLMLLAHEFVHLGYQSLEEGWDAAPALANFDKALQLDPDNTAALIGRAKALATSGNGAEAIEILTPLALHKKIFEAQIQMASILISMGDIVRAFKYLKKAKKQQPKNPAVWLLLADAFDAEGDTEQAQRCRDNAKKFRRP